MEDRLSKYLKSIVDYNYEKFEDYDLFKFEATFDEIKKEIKLYRGNESFKITTAFECPICNNDVFIAINSFNRHIKFITKFLNYKKNFSREKIGT